MRWATEALQFVYSKDFVLEDSPALFVGTPSASNANIRALLGPRVFFLSLGAVGHKHLHAAIGMLKQFELVAPVDSLEYEPLGSADGGESAGGDHVGQADGAPIEPLLRYKLGWRNTTVPRERVRLDRAMGRMHDAIAQYRTPLLKAVGGLMIEHNQPDLVLYGYVKSRFERDHAEATQRLMVP